MWVMNYIYAISFCGIIWGLKRQLQNLLSHLKSVNSQVGQLVFIPYILLILWLNNIVAKMKHWLLEWICICWKLLLSFLYLVHQTLVSFSLALSYVDNFVFYVVNCIIFNSKLLKHWLIVEQDSIIVVVYLSSNCSYESNKK